jgi:hypothetical protein
MIPLKSLVAILAASVAVVLVAPGVAHAKPARASARPCWKDVVNDWVPDGRVDGTYKVSCYQQALKHLPPDLREYSSAEQDFKRALLGAAATGKGGGPPNPNALIRGANPDQVKRDKKAHQPPIFRRVLDWLGPSNAESIPTPLLVLAGIAIMLLLAAAASFVTRWFQARKFRPATSPPQPPKRP